MYNKTGNNGISFLTQVLRCSYFIKSQLGRSERETRTPKPHTNAGRAAECACDIHIFVMIGIRSNFITPTPVIITSNMTLFRRTAMPLTICYMKFFIFYFFVAWRKQSHSVEYHEDTSQLLELNQTGGRGGQENKWHTRIKRRDCTRDFLMLGHREEMTETR